MIFNMIGGGGGGIELEVVGGTEKPTNPATNTIWVNTDTAIGNIYLDATEPTSPAEGDIWAMTGTKLAGTVTSIVQMKVCEDPSTVISLVGVKQYVDGAWAVKNDAFYDGSTWHDSTAVLLSEGTIGAYNITLSSSLKQSSSNTAILPTGSAPTFSQYSGHTAVELKMTGKTASSAQYNTYLTVWEVDLTKYTKIEVSTHGDSTGGIVCALMSDSKKDGFSPYAACNYAVTSFQTPNTYGEPLSTEFDISNLVGTYMLTFYSYYSDSGYSSDSKYLYEILLKRG